MVTEVRLTIEVPIDVRLAVNVAKGVEVRKEGSGELVEKVVNELRKKFRIEEIKDDPIARAYRDFYWRIGIDPTKQRPSGEALVRRALRGKIPSINNVVDAGNLASMETMVPIGLYDLDKVDGELKLRFAKEGERFLPIGGRGENLKENQIVLADDSKVLHVFPYRDSKMTMITERTRNVLIVACGVPGVDDGIIVEACRKATEYIKMMAGGESGNCRLIVGL